MWISIRQTGADKHKARRLLDNPCSPPSPQHHWTKSDIVIPFFIFSRSHTASQKIAAKSAVLMLKSFVAIKTNQQVVKRLPSAAFPEPPLQPQTLRRTKSTGPKHPSFAASCAPSIHQFSTKTGLEGPKMAPKAPRSSEWSWRHRRR